MTGLRPALAGYLDLRRSLGFKLARNAELLDQFISYLEERGQATFMNDLHAIWGNRVTCVVSFPAGYPGLVYLAADLTPAPVPIELHTRWCWELARNRRMRETCACGRREVVDTAELTLLTSLEDRHWWYKERRTILGQELRRLPGPGRALDIGAAGGGNTRVLKAHGWQAVALEYSDSVAAVARARGVCAMRADARQLPVRSRTCGLVTAFDVLEHIDEDYLAAAEIVRVLQPGGTVLIAVPCDMALWSAHDDAVGHVRRYSRPELADLLQKAGLTVETMWSWNVLLRPAVAMRRKSSVGSDLEEVSPLLNGLLTAVIVAERYLPVRSWPGVSLMARARRP